MTFRPQFWPSALTLVGLAILITLGVWQLQRADWKNELLGRIEAGIDSAPVPVDTALQQPSPAYAHVRATGRYRHDDEAYVFTSRERTPGALVFTPLVRAEGPAILVNRGFVPEARIDPATRDEGLLDGPVTVTGLLRPGMGSGLFTPDPDSTRRMAYSMDLEVLSDLTGTDVRADWFIEADASPVPGGLPRGRAPGNFLDTIPNNHMQYAMTWFALAAVLAGVWLAWHARRGTP